MKHRLAPALLATTLALPLAAEEAPPGLVCRVEGYDVALINRGDTPIPEGTIIAWSVPFSRSDGYFAFEAPLEPGAMVMMNGVLESSYLRPGTECRLETVAHP